MLFTAALFSVLSLGVFASPVQLEPRAALCNSADGDAPYSLTCEDLSSAVSYPVPFEGKPGGVVLLVHGTTASGASWDPTPYRQSLPNEGAGYDVVYFNSPSRSYGDCQLNPEYIAYNIKALAAKSATGKVFLVAHSQGNINVQWALAFWPSVRQYVAGYVALSGDFKGSTTSYSSCKATQALFFGACPPSFWQQEPTSNYIAAQNAVGGQALVSMTSLYSSTDTTVLPHTSFILPGAVNIQIQDVCPGYNATHTGMIVAQPAYKLFLDALTHGGQADVSRFDAADSCAPYRTEPPAFLLPVLGAPKTRAEPPLKAYVCARGAATQCEA